MEQVQSNGVPVEASLEGAPRRVADPIPPANPAIVGKLTPEEYLKIENLSLKVQNIGLQQQRMQAELIKANELRQALQKELEEMHRQLSAKYNVNILNSKTTQITEEGVIIDLTRLPTGVIGGGTTVKA